MSAVPLVRTCVKCGHLNEHTVHYRGTFDESSQILLFMCSVCDYSYSTPCADAVEVEEPATPELSDTEKMRVFLTWKADKPLDFRAWLNRETRRRGGPFW